MTATDRLRTLDLWLEQRFGLWATVSPLGRSAAKRVADRTESHHYRRARANNPIDSALVVVESFLGDSIAGNPRALLEAMLTDPGFSSQRFVVACSNPSAVPERLASNDRIKIVPRRSQRYQFALATAGTLINNFHFPAWFERRTGQLYINTWHGVPLKKMFADQHEHNADFNNSRSDFLQATHLALPSEWAQSHLLDPAGVRKQTDTKVHLIGSPRVDRLRNRPQPTVRTPQRILYAPTWRGTARNEGSAAEDLQQVVADLLTLSPQVTVKLHSFVSDETKVSLNDWLAAPQLDANDLLADTDVLITDYSSIMFDAFAADIPVVLLLNDLVAYESHRGLNVEPSDLPCEVARDGAALAASVRVARKPSTYGERFDEARTRYFPNEDGNATDRLLELILFTQL